MWALLGGEGQPGSLERAEGWGQRQRVAQGCGQMSHSLGGWAEKRRGGDGWDSPVTPCQAPPGTGAHLPGGETEVWCMLSATLGSIARWTAGPVPALRGAWPGSS